MKKVDINPGDRFGRLIIIQEAPKHGNFRYFECYKWYGGRGITVCDEWRTRFICFREWALSNGYSDLLTIDRVDVNGNYEPNNCIWVTIQEQQKNRRK